MESVRWQEAVEQQAIKPHSEPGMSWTLDGLDSHSTNVAGRTLVHDATVRSIAVDEYKDRLRTAGQVLPVVETVAPGQATAESGSDAASHAIQVLI